MLMAVIWTMMVVISIVCALISGNTDALAGAVMDGAAQAVQLCIGMAGAMCFWMGLMDVMKRSGLAQKLAHLLEPLLRLLYPSHKNDKELLADISANVSANLLGLGNAATPLGIRATQRMAAQSDGRASDDMIMLIVCNSASIQLIPSTVAAVRSAAGSAAPFDILPAVWFSSVLALLTGISAVKILARIWERRER